MQTRIPSPAMRAMRHFAAGLCIALLAACATRAPVAPQATQPRPAGYVSSAHPLATGAGLEVLRRGGSAIDAAIAIQAMLGLVEPQSSGLLGGAVLLTAADVAGRIVTRPADVEVGIVTALIGAPFFIHIVRRSKVREL